MYNCAAKSLNPSFDNLDINSKVNVLIEDAKNNCYGLDLSTVPKTDADRLKYLMDIINCTMNTDELERSIDQYINLSKKYFDYYMILGAFVYGRALKQIGLSLIEFVKKYFIDIPKPDKIDVFKKEDNKEKNTRPVCKTNNNYYALIGDIPNTNNPSLKPLNTNSTINKTIDNRVSGNNIANVFTEGGRYDPINNGYAVIGNNNHNPNCNCMECQTQHNALRDPISKYPNWDINQKADYLRKRITFIPMKNNVHEYQLDNLIYMVDGVYLQNKLAEYRASNRLLKEVVLDKTDNQVYDFKFWTESDIDGKVIVVLYNSDSHKGDTYLEVRLEDTRK